MKDKNPSYVIFKRGCKQYRVSEGDVVKIEKLDAQVGEKITLADVLFVGNDDDVKSALPWWLTPRLPAKSSNRGAPRRSSFSKRNGAKAIAGSRVIGSFRRR